LGASREEKMGKEDKDEKINKKAKMNEILYTLD